MSPLKKTPINFFIRAIERRTCTTEYAKSIYDKYLNETEKQEAKDYLHRNRRTPDLIILFEIYIDEKNFKKAKLMFTYAESRNYEKVKFMPELVEMKEYLKKKYPNNEGVPEEALIYTTEILSYKY